MVHGGRRWRRATMEEATDSGDATAGRATSYDLAEELPLVLDDWKFRNLH